MTLKVPYYLDINKELCQGNCDTTGEGPRGLVVFDDIG